MQNILDIKTTDGKHGHIYKEVTKCKHNFFYFLYNYIQIPYVGVGKQMTPDMMNFNMIRLIKCLFMYKDVLIDASRQLGKTTIAAALMLWYINFHSNAKVLIISFDQTKTKDILDRLKFMYNACPGWIKYKRKSMSERVLSFDLRNGSSVIILSPSPQRDPSTIGRGATVPFIYIDEPAFVKHFDEIFSAARPGITKARKEAEEMGIPSFLLMTSTPNGKFGTGASWYNLTHDAVNTDSLFKKEPGDTIINKSLTFKENHKQIYELESKNYCVYVRYHWSADFNKNPDKIENLIEQKNIEWYKKETATFSERTKSQEFDLVYLGSESTIFPDSVIEQFKEEDFIETILLDYESRVDSRKLGEKDYLKIYDKNTQTPNDYYIIGIDPAKSDTGDYAAIEVYSYLNFNQVAEYYLKPGSITRVCELSKEVIRHFYDNYNGRVIAIIETNFGNVIENLLNDEKFDKYTSCLYRDKTKKDYGLFTSRSNKKDMISYLYEKIQDDPKRIKSKELIKQLSTLEEKIGGRIEAGRGCKDDCVMASAFCAYIRYTTSIEYLPLISLPEKIVTSQNSMLLNDCFDIMNQTNTDQPSIYDDDNDEEDIDIESVFFNI